MPSHKAISKAAVLTMYLGAIARVTGFARRFMPVGKACMSVLHEDEHGLRASMARSHVTNCAPASAAMRSPDQWSQRAGGRQTLAGAPSGGVDELVTRRTLDGRVWMTGCEKGAIQPVGAWHS